MLAIFIFLNGIVLIELQKNVGNVFRKSYTRGEGVETFLVTAIHGHGQVENGE